MGSCGSKDDGDYDDTVAHHGEAVDDAMASETAASRKSSSGVGGRRSRHRCPSVTGITTAQQRKTVAADHLASLPPGAVPAAAPRVELPKFDQKSASATERRWFASINDCAMPAGRRAAIYDALGLDAKDRAASANVTADELHEAFFATRVTFSELKRLGQLFHSCAEEREDAASAVVTVGGGSEHDAVATTGVPPSPVSTYAAASLDADGIQRLGETLGLTSDAHVLYTLHRVIGAGSDGPWCVAEQTFMRGCMASLISSVDELRAAAALAAGEYDRLTVKDAAFGAFYRFLFGFVKASEASRSIPCDTAVDLWEGILVPKWEGGAAWVAFVRQNGGGRAVFRDLWLQLGNFVAVVTWPRCPEADEDSAWPSLIDGFIDDIRHPSHSSESGDGPVVGTAM